MSLSLDLRLALNYRVFCMIESLYDFGLFSNMKINLNVVLIDIGEVSSIMN